MRLPDYLCSRPCVDGGRCMCYGHTLQLLLMIITNLKTTDLYQAHSHGAAIFVQPLALNYYS